MAGSGPVWKGSGVRARLVRAASGSFGMKIFATGLGFLTSLLLARMLGVDEYGKYAYALAWVNLLIIPALLGFEKLLVRETAVFIDSKNWSMLRGLLRFANLFCLAASLLLISLAVVIISLLPGEGAQDMLEVLPVALILVPLMVLMKLRKSAMMGLHEVVYGQFPEQVIRPSLFATGLVLAYFATGVRLDAERAVMLNIAAVAAAFLAGAYLLHRAIPGQVRSASPEWQVSDWIRSALPLALLAGLQMLNARVDVVMLGAMTDAASVGIYNIGLQGAMLVSFVLMASNAAVAPYIAKYFAKKEIEQLQKLVTRSSRIMLLASLPIAVVLFMFSGMFLGLFGPDFLRGDSVLKILVAGQLINSAFGSVGILLTMTRHEKFAAIGAGVAAIINILLNLALIPKWGMEGAATASMVTLFLWNGLFAFWVYRKIGIIPTAIGRL